MVYTLIFLGEGCVSESSKLGWRCFDAAVSGGYGENH